MYLLDALEAHIFINVTLMLLCTVLSTASVYSSGYQPCHWNGKDGIQLG